jgi:reactive intermediate/imine deaminase
MSRQLISTGSKWEPIIGYSRAVKVGNQVFVSGTTGTNAEGKVAKGDLEAQVKQAILNIKAGLEKGGATLENVVRTRMYLTDISQWEKAARAHGEFFKDIRPATAMVEVSKLIDPDMMVEIEADAVVG